MRKIVDDTWRAKHRRSRGKKWHDRERKDASREKNKRKKKREDQKQNIRTRLAAPEYSLSPDNRQLEERGGCRGG